MRCARLSFSKSDVFFDLSRSRWVLISALTIAAVVLVTYFPSLGIGLWTDDYMSVDLAGRFPGAEYLVKFFDPRFQRFWYRPLVGIQWKIAYSFFRGEPLGYHLVQVALHLADCLLLYGLVARVTMKWRLGFVAALFYATLPLSSMAVYWPSVHDPLAGVFYLLTLWLWIDYLESGSRVKLALTFAAFVGALLTKEVSATLPIMLFLADRMLVNKPATFTALVRRYTLFAVILLIYAALEWIVITRSVFTQQIGYSVGEQNFAVFFQYLAFIAFPWEPDQAIKYVLLTGVILFSLYLGLKRDRRFLFLGAAGAVPTLVAAPIPAHLFNPRYLYLPLMASAVGFSLLLEIALRAAQNSQWFWVRSALGVLVAFVMISGSTTIAELTETHGGFIRQIRLQFRPIYQQHVAFAPDTLLYFIDTPLQTQDISGLMFLRYGTNVSVSGIDRALIGELHNHHVAFVYYLDDQNIFREQAVGENTTLEITPALPALFDETISLDALEIVSSDVKRGGALVVLLYWRATGRIDKDYTLFAHLVDEKGEIVAGSDSQPRKGKVPTSSWSPNQQVVDGLVLPITDEVMAKKNYRLEIGWYYLPTMERLGLTDSTRRMITDHLVIEPFNVIE